MGAKSSILVTKLPEADATGNFTLISGAMCYRVNSDNSGRVTGLSYYGPDGSDNTVEADLVVLTSFIYDNTRLLLLSKTGKFPDGLANSSGQVGKHFMAHVLSKVYAAFDDRYINNFMGPNALTPTSPLLVRLGNTGRAPAGGLFSCHARSRRRSRPHVYGFQPPHRSGLAGKRLSILGGRLISRSVVDVKCDQIAFDRTAGGDGHCVLSAEGQRLDHSRREGRTANARPDAGVAEHRGCGPKGIVKADLDAFTRNCYARNHAHGRIGDLGFTERLLRCSPCRDPSLVRILRIGILGNGGGRQRS